jgi:hypothetical protein
MHAGAYHIHTWAIVATLLFGWIGAIAAVITQCRRPTMTDLRRTSPDVVNRIVASARRLTRTWVLLLIPVVVIVVATPLLRWLAPGLLGSVAIAIPMWWRASRLNGWLDAPDVVCLLGRHCVVVMRGSQVRWLYTRSDIIARGAMPTIPSAQIASR